MKYIGSQNEYFEIQAIDSHNCQELESMEQDVLRLIWFTSDDNTVLIDSKPYTFNTNEIICLTQFHNLEYKEIDTVNLLRFNRQFYCILDHDSEVGCKGLLYYGASTIPIIKASDKELSNLESVWDMAAEEISERDELQLEMLQMMLKRILILCMRIYKKQHMPEQMNISQHDLVRRFNYLVEQHFREKHTVSEYAMLLFKSPKTISNTFKKMGAKTPLKYIKERLMLEARRLLLYTKKDISEIGYELGFQDIQSFSRFFKKQEGASPSDFRTVDESI